MLPALHGLLIFSYYVVLFFVCLSGAEPAGGRGGGQKGGQIREPLAPFLDPPLMSLSYFLFTFIAEVSVK